MKILFTVHSGANIGLKYCFAIPNHNPWEFLDQPTFFLKKNLHLHLTYIIILVVKDIVIIQNITIVKCKNKEKFG